MRAITTLLRSLRRKTAQPTVEFDLGAYYEERLQDPKYLAHLARRKELRVEYDRGYAAGFDANRGSRNIRVA